MVVTLRALKVHPEKQPRDVVRGFLGVKLLAIGHELRGGLRFEIAIDGNQVLHHLVPRALRRDLLAQIIAPFVLGNFPAAAPLEQHHRDRLFEPTREIRAREQLLHQLRALLCLGIFQKRTRLLRAGNAPRQIQINAPHKIRVRATLRERAAGVRRERRVDLRADFLRGGDADGEQQHQCDSQHHEKL